ncbi:hypothetical protein EZ428_23245 [Pedobacter frigiditerrae]|uniref:Uncharacterized protein n=1 Tax=Pedobacter frigiditerrae TaxID=2530452 RepID=A0A4R0MJ58_9SPHI|nr:hypothetical protein [Pedobacter frigiditerrae]TCC86628.1 hypothetical protein EZ428_23245 [Pedobacter frigiditerrae]
MRFLIAFILLFGSNFSIANAIENKTNAVIKKSSAKPSFSSKKEVHSLNEPLFELVDRIQQNINHHVLSIATFVDSSITFKSISTQAIKVFKRTVNYSYQFIFNCLFPKHTFW